MTAPEFYMGAGGPNSPYMAVAGILSTAAFTQAPVMFSCGWHQEKHGTFLAEGLPRAGCSINVGTAFLSLPNQSSFL